MAVFVSAGELELQGLDLSAGIISVGAAALVASGTASSISGIINLQVSYANLGIEGINALPTRAALAFTGTQPTLQITFVFNQSPPPTDFSLPPAWFAEPGFSALYVVCPQFSLDAQISIGISVAAGSTTFTGWGPTVVNPDYHWGMPGAAELGFTGQALALQSPYLLDVEVSTAALAGHAPEPATTGAHARQVDQAALTFEGQLLSFGVGGLPLAIVDTVALNFTGLLPGLFRQFYIEHPILLVGPTFTGRAPTPVQSSAIAVGVGAVTLAGEAPDVTNAGHWRDPATVAAVLEGHAPGFVVTALHTAEPPAAELALADPGFIRDVGSYKRIGAVDLGIVGYGPQITIAPRVLATKLLGYQKNPHRKEFSTDEATRHGPQDTTRHSPRTDHT